MILLFPDLDTLRLCLTSSIVAQEVTLAPAAATFDEQQRIYVEPSIALSRTTMKHLGSLGVKGSKRHAGETPLQVSNWLELVPLTKEAGSPQLSSQATILFELESGDDLPVLVGEMLRLGNDRQSFRWFALADEPDARRVLLRVIGPPYYTLLRAIDRSASGTVGRVRAYMERAPRVWVEMGYDHPFAAQMRVSESQLVLIRAPRTWQFLNDAPFQDIYDILQFQMPAKPTDWTEAKSVPKMVVPLRLTSGNAADVAEMWVLRGDGVRQLDTLVRDADDRLIQRLTFAVATDPRGRETVVLRTRPSKLPPPVVPLENAIAFKPFSKLPNLFVPAGRRLHPTLRRDAVRRLLADDADQVVWLYPDENTGFVPESVPDSAFRSLEDWVEYVIEAEREPLAAWIEATRFDFDHFICQDPGGPKSRPDSGLKEPPGKEEPGGKLTKAITPQAKPGGKGKSASRAPTPAEYTATPAEALPPNEWKLRREELQKEFLAITGPLDHPDRRAVWPQLAAANSGEGNQSEAALCWLNAIWDSDPLPQPWLAGWLRSETRLDEAAFTAAELDRRLKASTPSVNDFRAVIAGFLWAANQKPVPPWLPERLTAIQKFLESHEEALPIRAVWLAGLQMARLTGSDVLGLARVRDRLLQRLLTQGLSAEKDLPGFLRFAGLRDAERLQVVRDKALDLHRIVRDWTEHLPQNLPFVDLFFAFGLAKLGETTSAKLLHDDARRVLDMPIPTGPDPTSSRAFVTAVASATLAAAFTFRLEEAIHGRPHRGSLSDSVLDALDALRVKKEEAAVKTSTQREPTKDRYWEAQCIIDRFRRDSRILEPNEVPDPYRAVLYQDQPAMKELLHLTDVADPKKLMESVRRLFKHGVGCKTLRESQLHVLHKALPVAPRAGELFCKELIAHVPAAFRPEGYTAENPPTHDEITRMRGELIDRAIAVSAHFGRTDTVQQLSNHFIETIQGERRDASLRLIAITANSCIRQMKKFGMRDQIDTLLARLQSEVLESKSWSDYRRRHSKLDEAAWRFLQTLTTLAGGWLSIGEHHTGWAILDETRAFLFSSEARSLSAIAFTELAQSYLAALGHGDSDTGLGRIREFFEKRETAKFADNWTGAHTYTRLHLKIIEEAILALVSDEFALGPAGRKWLDDDEFLVRRRIHSDMKRHLDRSGI